MPHPGFDVTECQMCHEDAFTDFSHTYQSKKVVGSRAACHGDVATHAKSMMEGEGPNPIISFKTMTPAQVNETCLGCHDKRRQAHWPGGVHDRRGLSCLSCHSVHSFKGERAQIKTVRASD